MARKVGIIAYGVPDDRLKLEALARLSKTSASAFVVEMIRREFKAIYGDTNPKDLSDSNDR